MRLLAIALLLAGCAAVPVEECEQMEAIAFKDKGGGNWIAFNETNQLRLIQRMRDLQAGKCKMKELK